MNDTPRLHGSEIAVDGHIGSCAHGGPEEGVWITVDLGTEHSILRMAAYFEGCCEYILFLCTAELSGYVRTRV